MRILLFCGCLDFYPRSPCGERPWAVFLSCNYPLISIHALLAESDNTSIAGRTTSNDFYPRSPCGERLHYDNYNLHCVEISIHALLAESDPGGPRPPAPPRHFYPRSPCGERRRPAGADSLIIF